MQTGEQAIRLGKKEGKIPTGENRRSKRVRGEKVKTLFNLGDESKKKTSRKSTKQPKSCPEKTGYSAVKEKASELLCVHQLIKQPDRQKHMLRVPFQSYINSHPCPSLWVYHLTALTLTHFVIQDFSRRVTRLYNNSLFDRGSVSLNPKQVIWIHVYPEVIYVTIYTFRTDFSSVCCHFQVYGDINYINVTHISLGK